jgi:hypothetical protein
MEPRCSPTLMFSWAIWSNSCAEAIYIYMEKISLSTKAWALWIYNYVFWTSQCPCQIFIETMNIMLPRFLDNFAVMFIWWYSLIFLVERRAWAWFEACATLSNFCVCQPKAIWVLSFGSGYSRSCGFKQGGEVIAWASSQLRKHWVGLSILNMI